MPDAGASRKRQISGRRIPGDLTAPDMGPEPRLSKLSLKLQPGGCTTDLPRMVANVAQRLREDFSAALVCAAASGRRARAGFTFAAACAARLKISLGGIRFLRSRGVGAGCAGAIAAALFADRRAASLVRVRSAAWSFDSAQVDAMEGQNCHTSCLNNDPHAKWG
jgi:hypothetical protein